MLFNEGDDIYTSLGTLTIYVEDPDLIQQNLIFTIFLRAQNQLAKVVSAVVRTQVPENLTIEEEHGYGKGSGNYSGNGSGNGSPANQNSYNSESISSKVIKSVRR